MNEENEECHSSHKLDTIVRLRFKVGVYTNATLKKKIGADIVVPVCASAK